MSSDANFEFNHQSIARDGFSEPFAVTDSASAETLKNSLKTLIDRRVLGVHQNSGRNLHLDCDALLEICKSPIILDKLKPHLGEHIMLWQSQIWDKLPVGVWGREGSDKIVPWHFDAPSLPITGDSLSVWMALDTVTSQNGHVSLLPGSHSLEANWIRADQTIHSPLFIKMLDTSNVDLSQARDMILNAGEAFVFSDKAWHMSAPNTSDFARMAIVLRFCSQSAIPHLGSSIRCMW